MVTRILPIGLLCFSILPGGSAAQEPFPRILVQDSTRDNLVTPPGTATAPLGQLGGVATRGTGPGRMLLIPGLGFAADVFEPLMERLSDSYTMWAVTLPGFGGTPAPATPPEGTSYAAQTWTEGSLRAIEAFIEHEGLRDLVVVGHWLTGTSMALRIALDLPDRVRAVVLLSGSARYAFQPMSIEQRTAVVDDRLAQGWFKTVTRETWDDNNFLPGDYSSHPVLGLRLWREAARPALHVWIRYLLEFYAQDITPRIPELRVPTLLLLPGWEGVWHDPANFYQQAFTTGSWGGLTGTRIVVRTIPNTRAVMWADELDRVVVEMETFLDSALPAMRRPQAP